MYYLITHNAKLCQAVLQLFKTTLRAICFSALYTERLAHLVIFGLVVLNMARNKNLELPFVYAFFHSSFTSSFS
jgi:hypothetical protein